MTKLSIITVFFAVVAIIGIGCVKDKGYDSQQYGTNVQEKKAVAFPQAASSPVTIGITGVATPVTVNGTKVTLEQAGSASADVHVTLTIKQTLVTDAGLTPLPAGTFSVAPLNVVIPAGQSISDFIKVTVQNSLGLDPLKVYGVGLTISSTDGGYAIASNQKDIVIAFAIKNKYDGVYRLQGRHTRAPYLFPYDKTVHMVTSGPTSVYFYLPEYHDTGHYIGTGVGQTSWYGTDVSPAVTFNTATDLATNIYNLSTAVPIGFYTGTDGGVSRYVDNAVPTQRKMYLYFQYSGNPLRGFLDTLTYIEPRP